MDGIRIVELPAAKMATSENHDLEAFDQWWSGVSRDQDDTDGERVHQAVGDWVAASGCFALDEGPARHTLFHVITSDAAFQAMGYRQLDLYIPIRAKA